MNGITALRVQPLPDTTYPMLDSASYAEADQLYDFSEEIPFT